MLWQGVALPARRALASTQRCPSAGSRHSIFNAANHTLRMAGVLSISLVLVVLAGSLCAWAEDFAGTALRVEGTATGTGPAAVREANANAQLAALGEYLERYAPDGDLRVFRPLLENPHHYVRSFTHIDSQIESGVTIVTLRVTLDEEAIRREASEILLPELAGKARFLVLVAERGPDASRLTLAPDSISATAVVQLLRQAGLEVVDVDAVLGENGATDLLTLLADDASIRELLREYGADVAVVGRTFHESAQAATGSNLLVHRAELEVRIVGVREGAHTLRAEAKVLSGERDRGASTALRDVCGKLREQIVPLCVLAVAESGMRTGVLISVRGAVDAEGRDAIVDRLKKVPGVDAVEVLRHAPQALRLEVAYEGHLGVLYRHLTWDTYDGFRLSAARVVAREMHLDVLPARP